MTKMHDMPDKFFLIKVIVFYNIHELLMRDLKILMLSTYQISNAVQFKSIIIIIVYHICIYVVNTTNGSGRFVYL